MTEQTPLNIFDSSGNLRPKDEFLADVAKIYDTYS
jgi:hypothetical protein